MRRLRLPGLVLLPLAAALQSLTPRSVAERYAHLLYPRVAHFLSAINHHFSFSLAELVVGALLLAGIAAILWAAWPRPGVLRRLAGVLSAALATGGYLLLAFSLLWGLNYRRPPLAERLGIPTGGSSGDLAATAVWP